MLMISELDTALWVGSNKKGRILSLPLLVTLLLLQPRTQLAFWAASSHCQVMCILSSISSSLLGKAAFDLCTPQPVLILELAPILLQDLAPG